MIKKVRKVKELLKKKGGNEERKKRPKCEKEEHQGVRKVTYGYSTIKYCLLIVTERLSEIVKVV